MKAMFSPAGTMYLIRPPVFPSVLRGQPSLEMRSGFADWSLSGWQL